MEITYVTTKSGKKLPIEECKKIKGDWYQVGDNRVKDSGECYKIGSRYFRDTEYIVYDNLRQRYIINNSSVVDGVIKVKDDTLDMGKFEIIPNVNRSLSIIDKDNISYPLMHYEVIKDSPFFIEDPYRNGAFVHRNIFLTSKNISKYNTRINKSGLDYSCTSSTIKMATNLYNKNKEFFKIRRFIEEIGKELKSYTFGAEFETTGGSLAPHFCKSYGLIPLRDGSISGLEYATIPLSGATGIHSLIEIANNLTKNTLYNDRSCSFHLHIGGMPRTVEYITAFFKILDIVEDEIFDLFPLYKRNGYGIKSKLYTAPIPNRVYKNLDSKIDSKNINRNFGRIFNYLSMGQSFANHFDNDLNNVEVHNQDRENNRKWQVATRYHWINFIPLIFGNKQTIEFRIHPPSFEVSKLINFLFICVSLVDFVKNHTDAILKDSTKYSGFSLRDICLDRTVFKNSQLREELINYLRSRRLVMSRLAREEGVYFKESRFQYNRDIAYAKYSISNLEKRPSLFKDKYDPINFSIPSVSRLSSEKMRGLESQFMEAMTRRGFTREIGDDDGEVTTTREGSMYGSRRALEELEATLSSMGSTSDTATIVTNEPDGFDLPDLNL